MVFKSLKQKLVHYLLLSMSCFAVIATAFTFITEMNRSRDKAELMINQLLDTVENSAAIAVYVMNNEIAQEVVNGLLRNDIVHNAIIQGEQNFHIEQTRDTTSNYSKQIIRKLNSPFNTKKQIGTIIIEPEDSFIVSEAKHNAFLNALNSFFIITLTTIILLVIVRKIFLDPLTLVSNSLHAIQIGKEDRIANLPKNQKNELSRLIIDINSLLTVLEKEFNTEKNLRTKIEQIEKQLRNIFDSTSAGSLLLDQDGVLLTCNPTLLKILESTGLTQQEIIGKSFPDPFFDRPEVFWQMLSTMETNHQFQAKDLQLVSVENNSSKWVHVIMSQITDSNGQLRYEGVLFDISNRLAAENAIRYQAEYDKLTGLMRRDSAEQKLAEALLDPFLSPVCIMLLDLDGFKAVNDTYGHAAGDEVLVEVAKRFLQNVRQDDIVSRLGGDEFLIILKKCVPPSIEQFAAKIISVIQQPIQLSSGIYVQIGVSIGITINQANHSNVELLLKAADEAMYIVKRQGKNNFKLLQLVGTQ